MQSNATASDEVNWPCDQIGGVTSNYFQYAVKTGAMTFSIEQSAAATIAAHCNEHFRKDISVHWMSKM